MGWDVIGIWFAIWVVLMVVRLAIGDRQRPE